GSEDRIPLNRYPKRTFSGTYVFDTVEDVRRHTALMLRRFGGTFRFPLYQYQAKLKAPAAVLDTSVSINATRSDLRAGRLAIIVEGNTFEELEVDSVAADSVTFTTGLENDYSARAIVCPVIEVYTATGSGFTRRNPDDSASASFTYMEKERWAPFVDPLNEETVSTFGGLPVLDLKATDQQFGHAVDTGIRITDYVGLPDVFSPWDQAQWTFPLRWQVNRIFDLQAWLWWQVFADTLQGASSVFLLPTHRGDLEVVTPAALGGTGITVA